MIWEHLLLDLLNIMSSIWRFKQKINSFLNMKQKKKLWSSTRKYPSIIQLSPIMLIFSLWHKCNGFWLKLTEWLKKFHFMILIIVLWLNIGIQSLCNLGYKKIFGVEEYGLWYKQLVESYMEHNYHS